jgi:SpoVK/Ycf46/Vps4 family AAA+-type ATPase
VFEKLNIKKKKGVILNGNKGNGKNIIDTHMENE